VQSTQINMLLPSSHQFIPTEASVEEAVNKKTRMSKFSKGMRTIQNG